MSTSLINGQKFLHRQKLDQTLIQKAPKAEADLGLLQHPRWSAL